MDFKYEIIDGKRVKCQVTFSLNSGREAKSQCTVEDVRKLLKNLDIDTERVITSGVANNFNRRHLSAEFEFELVSVIEEAKAKEEDVPFEPVMFEKPKKAIKKKVE